MDNEQEIKKKDSDRCRKRTTSLAVSAMSAGDKSLQMTCLQCKSLTVQWHSRKLHKSVYKLTFTVLEISLHIRYNYPMCMHA